MFDGITFRAATAPSTNFLPLISPQPTMASKIAPLVFRTAARSARRAARPQTRALSVTTSRPSDSLMVVRAPLDILCRVLSSPLASAHEPLELPEETAEEEANETFDCNSTETHPTTTPASHSNLPPRMKPSSPRFSSGTHHNTRRPLSCRCWTSASASTASPASAS